MDAHRCAEEAIPLYLGEQEGKRGRAVRHDTPKIEL